MSLTIELPRPLGEELASDAQREGISAEEYATLLLYLATALLKEKNPTPFQETVRSFLAQRSLDAGPIASALEELVRIWLEAREGEAAAIGDAREESLAHWDSALVPRWRDTIERAIDVSLDVVMSHQPPEEVIQQRTGRIQRRTDDGLGTRRHAREREPDLVARVKSIRGKFARDGEIRASEELHRERQADKEKEEQHVWAPEP